jgi:hypothetical protein
MDIPELNDKGRMADIPLSPGAKITVERRGGLFHTEDFIEGRKAEAAGRPPVYQGR